jgi:serine/threonine-protein kinase
MPKAVVRALVVLIAIAAAGACSSRGVTRSSPPAARPPRHGIAPHDPMSLAVGPNGELYIADTSRNQILERRPDGRFVVIAGTGQPGFSGDGGPARDAQINRPVGMLLAKDGTLYFADEGNHRVRAVTASSQIATVVGDGRYGSGFVADGTPALRAALDPAAIAIGPGGDLYIAAYEQVLRLDRAGTLTEVLGGHRLGPEGVTHVGGPAVDASADGADGIAFDRRGDLYVAGINTKTLLVVDRDGVLKVPQATNESFYPRAAGDLMETNAGTVLSADVLDVVRFSPRGEHTVVSSRLLHFSGVGAFEIDGVAQSNNGTIYVDTDAGNGYASKSAIAEISPSGSARLLWHS